ncbi:MULTISPECIES: hypothetical protein [unclassified Yoonia]|uniref:hypothetical protein n=1 Tax=unclassified Yoonia TaxID=2629118 RepID=UPI002AFEB4D1|nr:MULTISPECIES: hypothetical protein [unclassified Yoonia]
MEHGYFHPDRGYWQTTNQPPQDILDGYPDGTVEVPLKLSSTHEWDGVEWVKVVPDATEEHAARMAAIIAERDRRMSAIASGYSPIERETWPVQVEEAKAIKADPDAVTPMLSHLAAARGLTVDQMADRVLDLNAVFATATGQIMAAATILLAMDPVPDDITDDKWWS